jgi:phosphoserine phosphatase RsbU/P
MIIGGNTGGLFVRFFVTYLGVLLLGSCFITLNNILIHGSTLSKLWQFNIKVLLAADLVFAITLCVITYIRISPAFREERQGGDSRRISLLHQRLSRFPLELFVGVMVISGVLIMLYHALDIVYHSVDISSKTIQLRLAENVMAELGLALTTALLLYSFTRARLRPHMLRLGAERLEGRYISGIYPLIVSFLACYLVVVLHAGRYLIRKSAGSGVISVSEFLILFGAYFTLAMIIFLLHIREIREEVRILVVGMNSLRKETNTSMHRPLPVISRDELGQLASAFNELQQTLSNEYKELDRQIHLAYDIQQRLLPEVMPVSPYGEIAACCHQSLEVGGDFYIAVELDEDRVLVAIGDVTGHGLPAALLMSAAMVVLRKEMERGGEPEELLTRMNRHVVDAVRGASFVTMGIARVDWRSGRTDYAGAGHMAPYLIRSGKIEEIDSSSLPLGIDSDTEYRRCTFSLSPGDLLVMYTDGIVEALQPGGHMLGFEAWEAALSGLDGHSPLKSQLEALLNRLSLSSGENTGDDRTVVAMSRHTPAISVRNL